MRQFPQVSRAVSRVCAAIVASVLVTAVVSPLAADAQSATGTRLLRSPSVSAQHVAFAYANNIWVVERAGGAARRPRRV